MGLNLYLFMIEAVASEKLAKAKPELRSGERYTINCFAVESSLEKAREPMERFFGKLGWTGVEVKREKQVPPKLSAIPDPAMQQLAKKAAEKGVAFTVYTKDLQPGVGDRLQ